MRKRFIWARSFRRVQFIVVEKVWQLTAWWPGGWGGRRERDRERERERENE
jgi:hypothetical protein